MDEVLRRIQLQMLKAHLRGEVLYADDWIEQYPTYAEEIRVYLARLDAEPGIETLLPEPRYDEKTAQARSLAIARKAIARAMVREKESDLGARMQRLRERPSRIEDETAPDWLRKHIVYAWIVVLLYEANGYCKRLRAQKVAYLLEQALTPQLFTEHVRKAAGPYDRLLRYKGERLAAGERWFRVEDDAQGTGWYYLAENSAAVEGLARRYLADPALSREFILYLGQLSNNDLEGWATVEDLALGLQRVGRAVTANAVRQALEDDKEYSKKKGEPYFSQGAIAETLWHLANLRLISGVSGISEET